jgi:hypothetical protein
MIKKFKKLMILINNCDKIIEMLENNDNKPKVSTKKAYSLFNTPREQKEYIDKKMKGEK